MYDTQEPTKASHTILDKINDRAQASFLALAAKRCSDEHTLTFQPGKLPQEPDHGETWLHHSVAVR